MAKKKTERYERGRGEAKREAVTGITPAVESVSGDGRDRAQQPVGRFARAAQGIRRIFTRAKKTITPSETPLHRTPSRGRNKAGDEKATRLVRRETDIPLDELDRTYTPMQTSFKASFRADGSDQQSSQEFANGADGKWSDEDRYTNRSGDPRIGTHGRTYEAAEEDRRPGRE